MSALLHRLDGWHAALVSAFDGQHFAPVALKIVAAEIQSACLEREFIAYAIAASMCVGRSNDEIVELIKRERNILHELLVSLAEEELSEALEAGHRLDEHLISNCIGQAPVGVVRH